MGLSYVIRLTKRRFVQMRLAIQHIFILILLCFSTQAIANDGVYYMAGNQLIPYQETTIEVHKELLQFTRKNDNVLQVRVRYELFNPGDEKTIVVGFEASPPYGDFPDIETLGTTHPYMYDFEVKINGVAMEYKTTILLDSVIQKEHQAEALKSGNPDYSGLKGREEEFTYVYYFNATFSPGNNVIEHFYEYEAGKSVYEQYMMGYKLEPITRWANGQVDEFVLELDLGEFQEVAISGLGEYKHNWDYDGTMGTYLVGDNEYYYREELFYTRSGYMTLRLLDFKPKEYLMISAPFFMDCLMDRTFDADNKNLSYSDYCRYDSAVNERSYRILRNLPYARRGYVFNTDFIQQYYETMPWYQRDEGAGMPAITEEELEWIEKLDEAWGSH